jgi:hypothetical protein
MLAVNGSALLLNLKDWSQFTETLAEYPTKVGFQYGFPMLPLATTMVVPEVLELLNRNSLGGMLIPRKWKGIASITLESHEVANATRRFRIVVVCIPTNPSMEVRRPKLDIEQPMSEVCPIVTPTVVDAVQCPMLEIVREEVTIDEGPVETLRSPNHAILVSG